MLRYIAWRIMMMVPTLLLISALVFTIIELPPGDYFESYISELRAQGEAVDMAEIEALRAQYGFDQPPVMRYFHWVAGMLQGDFGYSFEYQLPVNEVVGERLWLTVLVSTFTIIFTWLMAFPIGIYSATHQYSWGDYGLTFLGLIGLAVPNFLLAILLILLFGVRLRWLPTGGHGTWSHLLLPAVVLSFVLLPLTVRVTRGRAVTSAGKSHSWETPTRRDRSPRAQMISVALGSRVTMRSGGAMAAQAWSGTARLRRGGRPGPGVPGGAGRIRAAAQAARRCIERRDPQVEGGEHVGQRGPTRVVKVQRETRRWNRR